MRIPPALCTPAICAFFALALRLQAVPPPNDSYTNATALVGTSITFTGTVVGADAAWEPAEPVVQWVTGDRTVWWRWTAPDSSPVTLYESHASTAVPEGSGIAIWNFKKPFISWPDLMSDYPKPVETILLSWVNVFPYRTFVPVAGQTYQIQLRCTPEATFTFVLVSTNTPVIMEQPRTQTVSEDGHALFTVHAGGLKPFAYQWQFEGTPLPGETAAMLALTNVTPSQAGDYSVVVTNVGGATTSQVARLVVDQSDFLPSLGVLMIESNRIELVLQGQEGRPYRIESSTNLLHWSAETTFNRRTQPSAWGGSTSVILATNTATCFTITNTVRQKFVRAARYAPENDLCNFNLKRIRFAKEAWGRDVQCMEAFGIAQSADLFPYYAEWPANYWPTSFCPLGGVYQLNNISLVPTCTYGHLLEEPR